MVQIILINFAKQPTLSDVGYQHNQSIIKRRNRVQTILPDSVVSYVNNRLLCVLYLFWAEQNHDAIASRLSECVAAVQRMCCIFSLILFCLLFLSVPLGESNYRAGWCSLPSNSLVARSGTSNDKLNCWYDNASCLTRTKRIDSDFCTPRTSTNRAWKAVKLLIKRCMRFQMRRK